jgi:hypothetical protein
VTDRPEPDAWCTRQRSSLGLPPPRTATPLCPAETTSQSSNSPPAASSTLMPSPAGLSTVQRRTVGRALSRTSRPTAERVLIRSPVSSGAQASTSSAAAVLSWPSISRSCTPAAARTVNATPEAGAIRTVPGPSAQRRVTAWSITRFSR